MDEDSKELSDHLHEKLWEVYMCRTKYREAQQARHESEAKRNAGSGVFGSSSGSGPRLMKVGGAKGSGNSFANDPFADNGKKPGMVSVFGGSGSGGLSLGTGAGDSKATTVGREIRDDGKDQDYDPWACSDEELEDDKEDWLCDDTGKGECRDDKMGDD